MPVPVFVAVLIAYVGIILVAAWRILGDRQWAYATKPLLHRVGYFGLLLAVWAGVPAWMLMQAR